LKGGETHRLKICSSENGKNALPCGGGHEERGHSQASHGGPIILNIDMINIGQAIYDTSMQIQKGVKSLYGHAKAYAEAEEEYRMELAQEIMRLRDERLPVTIINDVARGNIAELKFKRDLAEVTYKTAKDMLQALQSQLSGLQTLYKRQDEI